MHSYRIYRLKEQLRQQFRWAPHTAGITAIKPKDYEESGLVEAANSYAVWADLRQTEHPLQVGDVLATESGELRIYKYVGFEEARWVLPEVKSGLETVPVAVGQPAGAAGAAG